MATPSTSTRSWPPSTPARSERTITQVGPICQIPAQIKFGSRRGQWYVYLHSVDSTGLPHTTSPESATVYQAKWEAHARMCLRAHQERLPWRVVWDSATISYHLSHDDALLHRAYSTDLVEGVVWADLLPLSPASP